MPQQTPTTLQTTYAASFFDSSGRELTAETLQACKPGVGIRVVYWPLADSDKPAGKRRQRHGKFVFGGKWSSIGSAEHRETFVAEGTMIIGRQVNPPQVHARIMLTVLGSTKKPCTSIAFANISERGPS